MGFMDELKRLAHPYEDEDEDDGYIGGGYIGGGGEKNIPKVTKYSPRADDKFARKIYLRQWINKCAMLV